VNYCLRLSTKCPFRLGFGRFDLGVFGDTQKRNQKEEQEAKKEERAKHRKIKTFPSVISLPMEE
jgi:hypothetical protein